MLDTETKRRIDSARDVLVGKLPNPQAQVEQITIAMIYKFMDDMDKEAVEFGGEATFFTGEFEKYSWSKIFDPKLGGYEMLALYGEAIVKLNHNPGIPQLFRDIFKNAFLPYRDPETLKMFLKIINEFHYDQSEKLGDAFEYLLSVLGSQGDAGQFRTPRHIIDFMVDIIQPKKDESICDPACGTAGFLISAYKYILSQNTKENPAKLDNPKDRTTTLTPDDRKKLINNFTGYDISAEMVRLSLVNLYLHGFPTPKIFEYDTLTSEDRWGDYFDIILANPPFMSPKGGIRPHKKFAMHANRSEVLFVDYIMEHINPTTGRAAIIVPEGIIFQSATAYKALRKLLVDKNFLYGVVSLPAGIFQPYSGVKTSILLIDKSLAKKTDKLLFVKIENDGFSLGAQRKEIAQSDLPGASMFINLYNAALRNDDTREIDIDNLPSKVLLVEKNKIAESGDYNLSVDRYKNEKMRSTKYEIVRLGDVCDVRDGTHDSPKYQQQGFPLITSKNIKDGYIDFTDSNLISEEDLEKINKRSKVDNGDIIMPMIGTIGNPIIVKKDREFGIKNVALIKLKEHSNIENTYLKSILSSDYFFKHFEKQSSGSTQKFISLGFIRDLQIPLPPLSIQQEIVVKIEQYEKIISGAKQVVENYKPQIDIKPEWEMVELGKIVKLSSGRGLTQQNIVKGEYPVYGGNGINGYHNDFFIENPIIVIGRVGAYCGSVQITEPKSWVTDNGLYVTDYLKEINQDYLAQILIQLNLNKFAKVGGQPSISQTTVYERQIPVPPLEYQGLIVEEILIEQKLVRSTKELISIYEQKIKDEINKLWAE